MPYRLMSNEEAEKAGASKIERNKTITTLNKMTKYRMAQKKGVQSNKINIRIAESNADAYLRYAMQVEDELKRYYAWVRQKIQDPATPLGQKRAYRKMQAVIESRYKPEWLMQNNPLFNPVGGNKSAYSFCWTKARIT